MVYYNLLHYPNNSNERCFWCFILPNLFAFRFYRNFSRLFILFTFLTFLSSIFAVAFLRFFFLKFSLLDYFFMFIYICFINLWKSALNFTVRSNKVYLLIDSWTDFWSNFIPWIFYNFIMIYSIEQPSPLTFFSILNLSLCLVSR